MPKGISEEELCRTIDDVVKTTINSSMTFGCYDLDDLRQEARIDCLEALAKWDTSRPLPNFLRSHVYKRYCNFIRDNYRRKGDSDNHPKKLLMSPIDLDAVDHEGESNISVSDRKETAIDNNDIWEKIDAKLPTSLRPDFLRLKNGDDLSRIRKMKVLDQIKKILWNNRTSQES